MKKYYVTFGQVHTHSVNGKTFDKDCLAEIEAETQRDAHANAMNIFEGKFHRCLTEKEAKEALHFFPRGIISVYHSTKGE